VLPDDQIEDMLPLPRDLVGQGDVFVMRVQGDSMIETGIFDDDYVVVRRQPNAGDGDVVAALVPGVLDDQVIIKRLCRTDKHTLLMPANPAYEPIDGSEAAVLGKVVAVFRRL
jgi:repressor LexA